jgi:hypothetical protein
MCITTDSSFPVAWIQCYNDYYLYYRTSDNHPIWRQQCGRYHRRETYIYMYYQLQLSSCLDAVVYLLLFLLQYRF